MDIHRLARTDLNLLVALLALLEEQNVSRAADRLYITQSAMSKTLSRLREMFDDPLFTRSSHGMVPTPLAIELHDQLEELLQNVDSLVGPHDQSPAHFRGRFNIAAVDHFALPVIPSLMSVVMEEAPEMTVRVTQDIDDQFRDMAEGRVDLALGSRRTEYDEDIVMEVLCVTRPVFLVRRDHPLKALEQPSWRDIMQYPEVTLKVLSAQGSRSSSMRARAGRYLKLSSVALEIPDYLTALETLSRSDAIMFAPRLSLDFVKATGAITSIPLPGTEGEEPFEVVMNYHKRTQNSAIHTWMRDHVRDIYRRQQQRFDQRDEQDRSRPEDEGHEAG